METTRRKKTAPGAKSPGKAKLGNGRVAEKYAHGEDAEKAGDFKAAAVLYRRAAMGAGGHTKARLLNLAADECDRLNYGTVAPVPLRVDVCLNSLGECWSVKQAVDAERPIAVLLKEWGSAPTKRDAEIYARTFAASPKMASTIRAIYDMPGITDMLPAIIVRAMQDCLTEAGLTR